MAHHGKNRNQIQKNNHTCFFLINTRQEDTKHPASTIGLSLSLSLSLARALSRARSLSFGGSQLCFTLTGLFLYFCDVNNNTFFDQ